MLGVGSEDTGATPIVSCWCLYCWLLVWLAPCSGVSVVDFGQENAACVSVILMTRFLLTNDISE